MKSYYTYLLKNKTTGKFYYGVKYGRDADPETFWKTYFTSSVYVKELIEKYGKSDFEFEIRKVGFKTKLQAISWEHKVLRRIGAVKREDFLNKNDGGSNWLNEGGYSLSEQQKENRRNARKNEIIVNDGINNKRVKPDQLDSFLKNGWSLGWSADVRETRGEGLIKVRKEGFGVKRISPEELDQHIFDGWVRGDGNKAMSGKKTYQTGKIFVRKDGEVKLIEPSELDSYLSNGWVRGNGNKAASGKVRINNGESYRFIESNEEPPAGWVFGNIPGSNKSRTTKEQVTCPHCGKTSNKMIMSRWHFDNCKERKHDSKFVREIE